MNDERRFGGVTYAQHGDDLFFLNLFDLLGVKNPTYLDIGAHHPTNISNTKLLYDKGSSGVNVEPNPYLYEYFLRDRPRDININVGVAATEGVMPFYMGHRMSGRNTFDPKERDMWVAEGHKVEEVMQIKVVTINSIVKQACYGEWPKLLTVDIEGMDYDVLKSAEFSGAGPFIICVETRRHDTKRMNAMMLDQGYHCLCRIIENLIYVRADLIDKVF